MKKLLNVLKYALLLAFSAAMMWYAVRGLNLSRVGESILQANFWWLGLTIVLSALGYFSRAYRWKMQIDATGYHPTYWEVYHAMMVGYLANLVLPRLGEVLRCSVLRRTSGVPVQVGVGTMITERVIDVLVLLLILGATLLLAFNKFWSFATGLVTDKYDTLGQSKQTLLALAVIGIGLGLVSAYLLWRNLERLRQHRVFGKVLSFVKGMLAGIFSIRRMKNKGTFLLHTIFTWVVYFLMGYMAFFAFPATQHLGLVAALAVLTFGTFGMAAPVQGGFGVYHLLVQSTLLVYGVSKEDGIVYALVVHGSQTLLVVLMGGISFALSMVQSGRAARQVAAKPLAVTSTAHVVE